MVKEQWKEWGDPCTPHCNMTPFPSVEQIRPLSKDTYMALIHRISSPLLISSTSTQRFISIAITHPIYSTQLFASLHHTHTVQTKRFNFILNTQ